MPVPSIILDLIQRFDDSPPNRSDDPQAIVRLIGQVITVSVETVKIVNGLPDLGLEA
jgi:predicted helicase